MSVCGHRPFEGRHFLGRLLLEFGQRAVLLEALVVQQLSHGYVGELLHEFEGLVDVEEDGEDVLAAACADPHHVRQQQRGVLLQLSHVSQRITSLTETEEE